ncbi:hypothetical protein [Curtobacterium aetherium]|uniref:Uncharacterized protein n=1 Tax=Curtobacterium aetherium TaxID=2841594 RepID=A0ACD1E2S1_9MICO|nr:hypothetical protein [Curtobacterium sp. L6-1]QWS33174.1 hypothetical protein KM842_13120 [Curtobacterium sp. L6-1]
MEPLFPRRPERTLHVARVLLLTAAAVLVLLWLVLWAPVWLAGSGATLLLWPLVVLVAFVAWCCCFVVVVMAIIALARGTGRGAPLIIAASVGLILVAPVAIWFVGPFSAVG